MKKKCTQCGEEKFAEDYFRTSSTKDKRRSECKVCTKTNQRPPMVKAPPPPIDEWIEEAVEEAYGHGPSVVAPLVLPARSTTVAVGDIHFPWHHKAAFSRTVEIVRFLQPENIVQMGDLYDLYSYSRFPRSQNVMTPRDETAMGREYAEFMWKQLKAAAPKAKCYQLWGNHDDRAMKQTVAKMPEAEDWVFRGIKDLMTFQGVTTLDTSKDELVIDDTYYIHGHLGFGAHVRNYNKNFVCGHMHKGGLMFVNGKFELNVGWQGDVDAPVFSYRQMRRLHGTTLGVGIVDAYGPRFVPYF